MYAYIYIVCADTIKKRKSFLFKAYNTVTTSHLQILKAKVKNL